MFNTYFDRFLEHGLPNELMTWPWCFKVMSKAKIQGQTKKWLYFFIINFSKCVNICPWDCFAILQRCTAGRLTKQAGQDIIVFMLDQQLYRVAVNISWAKPDRFHKRTYGCHDKWCNFAFKRIRIFGKLHIVDPFGQLTSSCRQSTHVTEQHYQPYLFADIAIVQELYILLNCWHNIVNPILVTFLFIIWIWHLHRSITTVNPIELNPGFDGSTAGSQVGIWREQTLAPMDCTKQWRTLSELFGKSSGLSPQYCSKALWVFPAWLPIQSFWEKDDLCSCYCVCFNL